MSHLFQPLKASVLVSGGCFSCVDFGADKGKSSLHSSRLSAHNHGSLSRTTLEEDSPLSLRCLPLISRLVRTLRGTTSPRRISPVIIAPLSSEPLENFQRASVAASTLEPGGTKSARHRRPWIKLVRSAPDPVEYELGALAVRLKRCREVLLSLRTTCYSRPNVWISPLTTLRFCPRIICTVLFPSSPPTSTFDRDTFLKMKAHTLILFYRPW